GLGAAVGEPCGESRNGAEGEVRTGGIDGIAARRGNRKTAVGGLVGIDGRHEALDFGLGLALLGGLLDTGQGGQKQRSQRADDGDNDEQFNQGETGGPGITTRTGWNHGIYLQKLKRQSRVNECRDTGTAVVAAEDWHNGTTFGGANEDARRPGAVRPVYRQAPALF